MQLDPTLEDLDAATETLRQGGDPRRSFCMAAVRLLKADHATLWEVDGELLRCTACNDDAMIETRLRVGPGSSAGRAAADGKRFFAADALTDPDVDRVSADLLDLRTILAEPVRSGSRPTGALTVGWRHHVADPGPLASGVISLMAVQAAMSIERADLALRLARQALTDPLTNLPNRRGLARELERELARATREGYPLAFAMLDLDHFKAYNDRHGHSAGDRLLTSAARAWRASVRVEDILARFGGDEFVLILPRCGPDSASQREIVERVRAATPDGQTSSVGLAVWDGSESIDQLAARADAALYAAKLSRDGEVAVRSG